MQNFLFVNSLFSHLIFENGKFYDNGKEIWMRGVIYYQPHACHQDFWKMLDESIIEHDLNLIKSTGFNLVMLQLNWGSFVDHVNFDGEYIWNEENEQKLLSFLNIAKNCSLYIAIVTSVATAPSGVNANRGDGFIDLGGVWHEPYYGYTIPGFQAGILDSVNSYKFNSYVEFHKKISKIIYEKGFNNIIWDPTAWENLNLNPWQWSDLCDLILWRNRLQKISNDINYWNSRWGENNNTFDDILFPIDEWIQRAVGSVVGNPYYGLPITTSQNKWDDFRHGQDEILNLMVDRLFSAIRDNFDNAIIGQRIDAWHYGGWRHETWARPGADFIFHGYYPDNDDDVINISDRISDQFNYIKANMPRQLPIFLWETGIVLKHVYPVASEDYKLERQTYCISEILNTAKAISPLGLSIWLWRDTYFDSLEYECGLSYFSDIFKPSYYKLMDIFISWNFPVTFSANSPLQIVTKVLPDGTLNNFYNCYLKAFGGISPYLWSILSGSLPSGLFLDDDSGNIYGTPDSVGKFIFTIELSDSYNNKDSLEYSLLIKSDGIFENRRTLYLSFDDSLTGYDGERCVEKRGTKFVNGKHGKGVLIGDAGSSEYLVYSSLDNFDKNKGSLEMWLRPNWNGSFTPTSHSYDIFYWGARNWQDELRLRIWSEVSIVDRWLSNGVLIGIGDYNIGNWKSEEWHHIAATWDSEKGERKLYVDSVLVSESHNFVPPLYTNDVFFIGGYYPVEGINSTVDELKIYNYAKSFLPAPNADFEADNLYGEVPLTIHLSDKSSGEINSWYWDFGDGYFSDQRNPTHTYNFADTFNVSLSVNGPGGSDTETKYNYIISVNQTGIKSLKGDMLPSKYYLYQNYPNPFNSLTIISFDLPQPSNVSISIFDLNGRLVSNILNRKRQAGYHSISWDASSLSTGIYFIKMETNNNAYIKKSIFIK